MELTHAGSMACVRGNEFEKPAARSTMKIQQKAAVFVAAGWPRFHVQRCRDHQLSYLETPGAR